MADLNRYKSRNPLPIIILFVVFFILTPLFTLTDKGVMDKIVGLKLMLYQTVLSTYSPHCDNVSIPKVQVMITYLYDKDGNYVPGTNGMPVNIANSKEARNPTWEQLVWFLKCDNTDKQK
ncbi:MAG: hypothetical protein NTZ34_02745 [Chloroflexi bacterium]|nr:hypothetical protein [Chloroflexota bacterium]